MDALSMTVNNNRLDDALKATSLAIRFKPSGVLAYKQALMLKLKGKDTDAAIVFNRAFIASPGVFKIIQESAPKEYRHTYQELYDARVSLTK